MIPGLARLLLLLIAVQALFSIPYLSFELVLARGGALLGAAAAGIAIGLLLTTRNLAPRWDLARMAVVGRLENIPTIGWLLALAGFGLVTRLAWVLIFPAPLGSDGSVYFSIAKQLAELGIYRDSRGEYAFWPPGYPFALLPFIMILGTADWVPVVANLCFYAASLPIVHLLARHGGEHVAPRLATLILAVWPGYVAAAGTASKELLLVVLLPLALLLYLWAMAARGRMGLSAYAVMSGAVFALTGLTQPGLLLVPVVLIAYEHVRREPVARAVTRLGLVLATMSFLVGAWTYRNARVLGSPVLVSTNGGSTFYRANNPWATGGYTERGERSLEGLGEMERHQRGLEYAKEWISSHPVDFLKLAWRKQVLFLGDDASGVYETLKRGLRISDDRYFLLKMACNAFWLMLWLLILSGLFRTGGAFVTQPTLPVLLALTVSYFWLIDSVFESGSRHHMPLMGILSVLATIGSQEGGSRLGTGLRGLGGTGGTMIPSLIRYGLVGAVGTAAHYLVLLLLVERGRVAPTLATTVGFATGAMVNYFLNFRFTFQSNRAHRVALPRFLAVAAGGMLLNAGIVALGTDVLRLHYMIPQVGATGTVVLCTFLANRAWTF